MPGVPLDVMDKLKAIFKRKSSKSEPGASATAGTKTDTPAQAGVATQVPQADAVDRNAAPSSAQPVAPAGAAPVNTSDSVDPTPEPPKASEPVAPAAGTSNPQKEEAAAAAAPPAPGTT